MRTFVFATCAARLKSATRYRGLICSGAPARVQFNVFDEPCFATRAFSRVRPRRFSFSHSRLSRRSHFTTLARDVETQIQKSNLASPAESRLSLRFRRARGCARVRNTRKRDSPVTSTVERRIAKVAHRGFMYRRMRKQIIKTNW